MYLKILVSTQYLKLIYFDINFDVIYIIVFFSGLADGSWQMSGRKIEALIQCLSIRNLDQIFLTA